MLQTDSALYVSEAKHKIWSQNYNKKIVQHKKP